MMINTVVIASLTLFFSLLIVGGYNLLYTREVLRLEETIGVTIPKYIHTLLKTVTFFAFTSSILGLVVAIISYFFS